MANDPTTASMSSMPPRPPGASDPAIKLYQHSDRGGWQVTFIGEDVPYIGDKYNDQVSSVDVVSGVWELFEHVNFNKTSPGDFIKLKKGSVPNLDPLGMNDKITSLRPIGW